MTLNEIIQLFQDIEQRKNPPVGFHLHNSIRHIMENQWMWETNQNQPATFSGFLKALRDYESPCTNS